MCCNCPDEAERIFNFAITVTPELIRYQRCDLATRRQCLRPGRICIRYKENQYIAHQEHSASRKNAQRCFMNAGGLHLCARDWIGQVPSSVQRPGEELRSNRTRFDGLDAESELIQLVTSIRESRSPNQM